LNSLGIHAHLAQKCIARFKLQQQPKELERAAQSTSVLVEEVERLSRIVDEFLQAARPTKPQFNIKNVNDVLRHLADLMSAEAAQRKIAVEVELDDGIPATRIDEFQLGLAFRNIVKNSMEAIDHRGGTIHIRSKLEPEDILIEFRDSGCGIPADKIRRIFEPYVTTKFSGTGLGLMTVHRIVTEHTGAIVVKSKEGEGALFRITLPLKQGPRGLLPDKSAENSDDGKNGS
jgi:signal transduction histidine kinase